MLLALNLALFGGDSFFFSSIKTADDTNTRDGVLAQVVTLAHVYIDVHLFNHYDGLTVLHTDRRVWLSPNWIVMKTIFTMKIYRHIHCDFFVPWGIINR